MEIKYNYLPEEFQDTRAIFEEWEKLIASTEFTLGSYVERFESKFSSFMRSKHCISTNNGTDALILSLKCLGIGPGDEVITVTNTFYATVGAIVAVGATPVLIDCDKRFQINVTKICEYITDKTKAVIPVHWGGGSPEMEEIIKICNKKNLLLIEDACMGIGGFLEDKPAGTFGQINAFSMHPLKSLNVMGDGGMVLTEDDECANWMRKYRNHGMIDRDNIEFWGVNMRLQPLQAVVASLGLDKLEKSLIKRRVNASLLDEGLLELVHKGRVQLPKRITKHKETYALYMGLFDKRDELMSFLAKEGIETKIHYPIPMHRQVAARSKCRFNERDMENADYQAERLLTLPVHQFLKPQNLTYIIESIKSFYLRH